MLKDIILALIQLERKRLGRFVFFVLFIGLQSVTFCQEVFRIEGDFSIKSKSDGQSDLVMGRFYYDINHNQLIYRNFFPEKETWVSADTNLYLLKGDKIIRRETIPNFIQFSIFHLALTHNLKTYGIDENLFTLDKVEKENGMVISTYSPKTQDSRLDGEIVMSAVDGKLFGIVFLDRDKNVIKKQFFEDYTDDKGMPFPGRIVEIINNNGLEFYKITSFKNIVLNANNPDSKYFYNFN